MLRRRMLLPAPELSAQAWDSLLAGDDAAAVMHPLYGPLIGAQQHPERSLAIGRAAQSLDGFIASASGASRWIGGEQDILHTHRLRALCDAVIVGAATVRADDPMLTTRACAGPSPVRVVIDPRRRLSPHHQIFGRGPPTLLLAAAPPDGAAARCGNAEIVVLPDDGAGHLAPDAIIAVLAARGLRRLLLEGGGRTVTRFLLAGALDRLHVTVAPLLLGQGIRAFAVPASAEPSQAFRVGWQAYALGTDVLLDIPLVRRGSDVPA